MSTAYPTPRVLGEPRSRRSVLVSIAVPALNEAENLPVLYAAIKDVMEAEKCRFEFVVADNGSSDNSLDVLDEMAANDPRVRPIALSRNFGHQGGLIAAMEHARGDVVVTMDADMQHPPHVIPELLAKWEDGYDVINTHKSTGGHVPVMRRLANNVYYWIITKISGIPMAERHSDFRLMDRRALDALMALKEKNKYLRGLSYWIGFVHGSVPYSPRERHGGKSRYLLRDLIRFAADGLLAFSILPLRLFTYVGGIVSILSLLYGFYVFAAWLFGFAENLPPGWASLAIGVYFFGGVILIGIGVLGEYIGRTFDETRQRPSYILRRPVEDPGKDNNA